MKHILLTNTHIKYSKYVSSELSGQLLLCDILFQLQVYTDKLALPVLEAATGCGRVCQKSFAFLKFLYASFNKKVRLTTKEQLSTSTFFTN